MRVAVRCGRARRSNLFSPPLRRELGQCVSCKLLAKMAVVLIDHWDRRARDARVKPSSSSLAIELVLARRKVAARVPRSELADLAHHHAALALRAEDALGRRAIGVAEREALVTDY